MGSSDEPRGRAPDSPIVALGTIVAEQYVLREVIGRGGMGQVFRAEQTALGRDIALKIIRPGTRRGRARLMREAESLARLESPNTVVAHDVGSFDVEGEEFWYIAMQLVPGETLKARIGRGGALSTEDALDVASDIARSLSEAHGHEIVHRDLKPSNVMISETHGEIRARVLDFGIAKQLQGESLSDDGEIVGSPRYMAPEQFVHESVDSRADIYTLGIVLFEMLTGEHPLGSAASLGDVLQWLTRPPPDPSERLSLPPAIVTVVQRCMARSPADRYQSMEEILEALSAARPRPKPTPWRRIALASALVALLASLFAWSTRTQSESISPAYIGGGRQPPVTLLVPRNDPFWQRSREFFLAVAEDLDRSVLIYDAEDDPERMVLQAKDAVTRPSAGLITQSFEGRGPRVVRIAREADVPVVGINNDFAHSRSDSIIRPDDERTGFELAEHLIAAARPLAAEGPVRLLVVHGRSADAAERDRARGLERALRAHPDVSVVARVAANWQRDRARALTEREVDDAHAIWATTDAMALGAIEGAIRAGREPGIDLFVGGIDWTDEGLAAVAEGTMAVTFGGHFMEAGWALVLLESGRTEGLDVFTPMCAATAEDVEQVRAALRAGAFQRVDFRSLVDAVRRGDTDVFDPERFL